MGWAAWGLEPRTNGLKAMRWCRVEDHAWGRYGAVLGPRTPAGRRYFSCGPWRVSGGQGDVRSTLILLVADAVRVFGLVLSGVGNEVVGS